MEQFENIMLEIDEPIIDFNESLSDYLAKICIIKPPAKVKPEPLNKSIAEQL